MTLFKELENIVAKLRHPETGCPWDKKQTAWSLIPNFIEEIYETVEAIEDGDDVLLAEELGDVLLHIMLQVKIAEERQAFTMDDVLKNIINKLIRRHPHVFADLEIETSEQAKLNWERIKLQEKKKERKSVIEGVPKNMPALIQAQRIQEKAASVGFDWDSLAPVFEKISEEIAEVKAEMEKINNNDKDTVSISDLEIEIGDLFFAVVNLSRKLKIDSETALRMSTEKFKSRFQKVEKLCEERHINMNESNIEVLDELWDIVKQNRNQ